MARMKRLQEVSFLLLQGSHNVFLLQLIHNIFLPRLIHFLGRTFSPTFDQPTMSRHFSSAARALLKFIWQGMGKDSAWEAAGERCILNNSKLPAIETAQVK